MAEIVSAFPTAGGIYYWASKLGGPVWGWFTGWFNLIGLIGVVASVDYACAQFLFNYDLAVRSELGCAQPETGFHRSTCSPHLSHDPEQYIFPSHILAYWNNTSAVWHIVGPAIIVIILIFVPDHHQSVLWVFTERANGSGFFGGETGGAGWLFHVLPFGALLLTQYTITGFDACAHLLWRRTRQASMEQQKGVSEGDLRPGDRRLDSPAPLPVRRDERRRDQQEPVRLHRDRGVPDLARPDRVQDRDDHLDRGAVLLRRLRDDVASGMITPSAATTQFRAGAVVEGHGVEAPRNATMFIAVACAIVRSRRSRATPPCTVRIFALTAITVIGLYIAYAIPIFLRWRMGDSLVPGPWTLGNKYSGWRRSR